MVTPIWLGFPARISISTSNGAEKSIVVRAVQRRRYTDTNGRTVRRIIRLNGPILSSDLEGMKDGEQVTLWIEDTLQLRWQLVLCR